MLKNKLLLLESVQVWFKLLSPYWKKLGVSLGWQALICNGHCNISAKQLMTIFV